MCSILETRAGRRRSNAEFWLNLQNFYDLEVSRRSGTVSEIGRQVHPAPSLAS